MSNNSRRVSTPLGPSRKRKERTGFDATKVSKKPTTSISQIATADPANNNNRLLAGYLAHEFLTKGTLFGQRWDPTRATAAPVASDPKKTSYNAPPPPSRADLKAAAAPAPASPIIKPHAYADVAHLLKTDGAHVPGIVNPTQLFRWLQM